MSFPVADAARRVIERAIADRIFPAAVVDVGSSAQSLWSDALGTLTFAGDSPPVTHQTPFDLASLTKTIATTSVVMELVRLGAVRLDEPVAAFFEEWRGSDREQVTVRDLLEHASGLPARLLDPSARGRREFEHDICTMPLEYATAEPSRSTAISDSSCSGFLAADRGGASLSTQFDRSRSPVERCFETRDGSRNRTFGSASLGAQASPEIASRRADAADGRRRAPWAHCSLGEVHDNYAAALGGVAGHAGLFGTAPAVGAFARAVLRAARGDEAMTVPSRFRRR